MATAKKQPTKSAGAIPPREVVLVIVWLRSYASRFTDPKGGRKPVILNPGPNEITDEQVGVLEKHRDALSRLEKAGHLRLEQPRPRAPEGVSRAPVSAAHELSADERAELEELRARVATNEAELVTKLMSPPATSTSSADDKGPAIPMPDWTPASTYDELKVAATARGIEFPGNVSKAKLLEDLEAWDDEQLVGDGDEAEDDEKDEGAAG